MISIATVKGAVRTAVTAYRVGVIVDGRGRHGPPQEPAPMPLSYRDVEHIRRQIASAASHRQISKK
jgi:hypothetical protein